MSRTLTTYVVGRLPRGYMLTNRDRQWLEVCATYHDDREANHSVLEAVKKAVAVHGCSLHLDPYELLIDAGICSPDLKTLP